MPVKIEYGPNHGAPLISQQNYNGIGVVTFLNWWDIKKIDEWISDGCVAIWRVKAI